MKADKKHSYRYRLISILSILLLLFCIPYALILYRSSKARILDAIQVSNNQNLQQIKYNYDMYNDMMSNLCFTVYLDNKTQSLLYSPSVTYNETSDHINYLRSTILNIYPSVYSLSIYNGIQHEFYSTLTDFSAYQVSLADLFDSTDNVQKLQPVLRKIPNENGRGEFFVFSYLLYDFEDNDQDPLSYIVLEQNANWLIQNFADMRTADEDVTSSIYLINRNGDICSQENNSISKADQKLIKKCLNSQSTGNIWKS